MCIRDRYQTLGSLTVKNFKHILRQNLIENCPVTLRDVEIAEDIYGPDIATLKGRNTRKRPPVVTDDQVDIPDELVMAWSDLTLCINNMYVHNQVFLTAIDTTIRYRLATHLMLDFWFKTKMSLYQISIKRSNTVESPLSQHSEWR